MFFVVLVNSVTSRLEVSFRSEEKVPFSLGHAQWNVNTDVSIGSPRALELSELFGEKLLHSSELFSHTHVRLTEKLFKQEQFLNFLYLRYNSEQGCRGIKRFFQMIMLLGSASLLMILSPPGRSTQSDVVLLAEDDIFLCPCRHFLVMKWNFAK